MGILAGIAVGIAANFLFEHIDILRRLRYDRTKRRKKGATHENSSHVAWIPDVGAGACFSANVDWKTDHNQQYTCGQGDHGND